jgi:hypothetical protein
VVTTKKIHIEKKWKKEIKICKLYPESKSALTEKSIKQKEFGSLQNSLVMSMCLTLESQFENENVSSPA